MSTNISKDDISKHLEDLVINFAQGKLELIMQKEMKNYFKVDNPSLESMNGFFRRVLDTRDGRIDDLAVPPDHKGYFTTHIFNPYQRWEKWLGETIINMYQHGFSSRDIGTFMERIIGKKYFAGTGSNIANVVMDIEYIFP